MSPPPSPSPLPPDDAYWMGRALTQARAAAAAGEVPVGAVLLSADGALLAEGHNRTLADRDPTAHAEVIVLRDAGRRCGHRLTGAVLYVTLEPCAMCAGAASHARVGRVVYGADDPKGGALAHGPRLFGQPTVHWRPEVTGGVRAQEAGDLLRGFFQARRRSALRPPGG